MEMNKKMFALSQKMKALHKKAEELSESGDTAGARSALDEFAELEKLFKLEGELFHASKVFDVGNAASASDLEGAASGEKPDAVKSFAAAFRNNFRVSKAIMNEGTASAGGYLVPQDIVTMVNEYKSVDFDFSDYIDIEPVETNKGSRVYGTKADDWAFQEVAENEEIPVTAIPHFETIAYDIKNYGGIIAVSKNLIYDSDQAITNEAVKWLRKGRRGTINQKTLAIAQAGNAVEIGSLDDIQTILISVLGGAYSGASMIFTNDDGIAWLAQQKDKNGRSFMMYDPTQPAKMQIAIGARVVPLVNVPNGVMRSTSVSEDEGGTTYTTTTIPFIIGDLRSAVKCFDRQQLEISGSDQATVGKGDSQLNAFSQRLILFEAYQRMDFKEIDPDAIVYAAVVKTDKPLAAVGVAPEKGNTTMFGHKVGNLQSGMSILGDSITGTLKYVSTGALATDWGAGNFLALKFSIPEGMTSVKVGLDPSESTGLVEIIDDPDGNGVFKITDKDTQIFVIEATDGRNTIRQEYDLSGLNLLGNT